jgi:hypothetical protein
MWMAGGGVKGGLRYGSTDEFGIAAQEDKFHTHDFHATTLHLMGLDHTKLLCSQPRPITTQPPLSTAADFAGISRGPGIHTVCPSGPGKPQSDERSVHRAPSKSIEGHTRNRLP